MEQRPFFADVDLPFHVWVREGRRWVLRNAAAGVEGEAAHSSDDRRSRAGDPPVAG